MTPDELTRLREEVARLRAAIAPTTANALALALSMNEGSIMLNANGWVVDPDDVAEVLAAINERAKL